MMKELSMHILDIVQNSIKAGASSIEIIIVENEQDDLLSIEITDNGRGMPEDMLESVRDPFTTTRTTRKVGLGIPMLEQTCLQCGGGLTIRSAEGAGTTVKAAMSRKNIDRPPMGDLIDTMHILFVTNLEIDFIFRYLFNEFLFEIDTAQIKDILDGVPLNEPSVMQWLKDSLTEGLADKQ